MNSKINKAKRDLLHYFRIISKSAGYKLTDEDESGICNTIDCLVEGIMKELKKESK